jgi:hypothetical protein
VSLYKSGSFGKSNRLFSLLGIERGLFDCPVRNVINILTTLLLPATLNNPNNINLSHIGRARVSVRVRCLVLVKLYGNNPRKLFVRIIRNRDVKMNEFPLFSFPFLKIVFISWCNLFINKFTIMLFRDDTSQILVGINRSPIAVLVQFNDKLLISYKVCTLWKSNRLFSLLGIEQGLFDCPVRNVINILTTCYCPRLYEVSFGK